MMVAASANMEVETSRSYIDHLYSTDQDKCGDAVIALRNAVIGSNKKKDQIVEQGILARLVGLLVDPDINPRLKTDVVHTLSSISRGTDTNIKTLMDSGAIAILLNGLVSSHIPLVSACLECLRTVLQHREAPTDVLYSDTNIVPHLLSLLPQSPSHQISICSILTCCCKTNDQQSILVSAGAAQAINAVLCSSIPQVQLAALRCLATMAFSNECVAGVIMTCSYGGRPLIDQVLYFLGREHCVDIQLASARILSYLYRCGVLPDTDTRIVYGAMPCLVRVTKKEETVDNRILAAETLGYLIEVNADLQRNAAISNHLILTVAGFLRWEPEPTSRMSGLTKLQLASLTKRLEVEASHARDMKRAAFRVFASLGANDEDLRKKIIDTEPLMDSLVSALDDADPDVQMSAIRCLHSLSRSVQLLRTTFQDNTVWRPLMKILSAPSAPVDSLVVASSTLCNLLLEFSPSKEPILESGAVEMLCALTHKYEPALRLNGVWGLMNMAFQAEQRIKVQIMTTLTTDQVFRLVSDTDINVVMKTLGLLRNLLSNKHHIDHISAIYGKQMMQAVVLILEADHQAEVKEQALCILANIADGDTAKQLIMANEDMLKKVTNYMVHNNTKLQIAAVVCILNLIWRNDEGSAERQCRLKDIGVFKILHQLLSSSDNTLFEKVKLALQQLNM